MTGISRNKQSSWPTGPDQLELLVQKNALVGNNQASCSEDLPSKHNRINQPDHRIHRQGRNHRMATVPRMFLSDPQD